MQKKHTRSDAHNDVEDLPDRLDLPTFRALPGEFYLPSRDLLDLNLWSGDEVFR